MNRTLKRIWDLTVLCVRGPGGKVGILYCCIILGLNLFEIYLSMKMIMWNKDFYSALEKYDASGALYQIGVFAIITGVNAFQYLVATYLRQLVQIRWRTILTNTFLGRWFADKAFWHLNTDESSALDNPDQRISEDCRIFVDRLTGKALDLFSAIISLSTYVFILWKLSDFPLEIHLFGETYYIRHYLIIVAPIYVLISSTLTHWMGSPLMRLNVIQQHREADMRFALARLREFKEAVALENGEKAERKIIDNRYLRILDNWRARINREFILGLFTRPYYMTVLRIPTFLAFPAYLAGHVALGGLMQLGSAFMRLVTTMSWFIFSYRELAELSATTNRLSDFMEQIDEVAAMPPPVEKARSNDGSYHIKGLTVCDPSGRELLSIENLTIQPGDTVWIDGPSGIGKSTLLKALSGIWPHCRGKLAVPEGKTVFSPQKAYLPLGSLAECVAYPEPPQDMEKIRELLQLVGLNEPRHEEQLKKATDIGDDYRLSGGELQRLQIARILYAKPDWIFLDEGTSSLDIEAEEKLYRLIRTHLPDSSIIVIAHREPKGLGTYRHIDLWKNRADRQEQEASTEPDAAGLALA